ncbi:MAG TPA: PilC/PilY family type IV pilus protein, partial [Burkholderiaceae bacterium]|nr:PilC/PilY family type IV pilus protein [Burkholderiaceae bacterium]
GTITAGTYVAGDTGIFVPYFDTSTWFGELEHYAVSVDSSGNASIASTTSWKASEQIPVYDEVNGTTDRNIVLGSALGGGMSFEWTNLSTSQQAQLNTNPHTLTDDGNGVARVAYLRGSRADEGIDSTAFVGELPEGADGDASGTAKPFRVRTNILGDIVNSSPVYVGKPNSNISEALGPGYQAWSTDAARQNRTRMVYVAANDGMVHGFDVSNGAEVLAYIPSQMVAKLAKLTHPGYKHEPFVDGSLTSADAYANGAWRTVLAGAYGGGARGVFALDVTDPAAFSSTSVLWEFSAANDPDMGYVVGKVLIAPVKVGSTIKWFVVTASGYNNYGADGTGDNANGYLFLLALDKASGVAWQQNTNYYKIQIPLDTSSTAAMGLAQPGGVYNHLGVLTRMYAGDLRGNLWRVDLTSSTPSSWAVSAGSTPLFVATDANGNRQPITVAPAISYGPSKGYIVSFGTGRLLATGDTTARAPDATTTAFDGQSFYSVWDDLSTTISGRSSLASRSVSSGALTGTSFTYGNGTGQKRGWYFDFPAGTNNGERTISPALLSYGRVFLNTVIPGADPCANGQSVTYVANVLQGTGTAYTSVVGYVATPLLMRSQLIMGTRDPTMYGNATLTTAVFNIGTDGRSVTMQGGGGVAIGSWTWRELLNWRELRR